MGKWGNQARRKHQREQQKRRQREKVRHFYNEHVPRETDRRVRLPNLTLLVVGATAFVFDLCTSPWWWTAHLGFGVVAFAIAVALVGLAFSIGENDNA